MESREGRDEKRKEQVRERKKDISCDRVRKKEREKEDE